MRLSSGVLAVALALQVACTMGIDPDQQKAELERLDAIFEQCSQDAGVLGAVIYERTTMYSSDTGVRYSLNVVPNETVDQELAEEINTCILSSSQRGVPVQAAQNNAAEPTEQEFSRSTGALETLDSDLSLPPTVDLSVSAPDDTNETIPSPRIVPPGSENMCTESFAVLHSGAGYCVRGGAL